MGSDLEEKDFIQEKNPKYVWIFLAVFIAITLLTWGLGMWQHHILKEKREEFPFFRVTNREFSLFLWQNPQYMRAQAKVKFGYLPHFHSEDEVRLVPHYADMYVIAPIDLLFRYHAWNRLLGDTLGPHHFFGNELSQFLNENQEWLPKFWSDAPPGYVELIKKLPKMGSKELSKLPYSELPFEVRFAFQGWKNYFKQWSRIEAVKLTQQEMLEFLNKHPHYNRSYWRNILSEEKPEYLLSFQMGSDTESDNPNAPVPEDEYSNFLKIGIFNYSESLKTTNPSS